MDMFGIVLVSLFVVAVLGIVTYAIFEMTPFAHHENPYRDPVTHQRLHEPPNLEDGHY